jgi:hypothetical protein
LNEIKFLQKILEFFNFNVCLARRDAKSQQRLKLLLSIIPSFKELSKVFKQYELEETVSIDSLGIYIPIGVAGVQGRH